MEKRKGKLKRDKFLNQCNTALETPVAMDLSTDITRLFQVNVQKKKRISEFMCESIRKTKRNAGISYQLDHPLPLSHPTTAQEFVEFSNKCPSVSMSRHLEKHIKKMIRAHPLEVSHPQLLTQIIKEAKEEYTKVLHYVSVNQKIANSYPEVKYSLDPFKFLGRTEHYKEYLITRKRLKSNWILHYPIVRSIFKECVTNIPSELCHMKFDNIFELDDIEYILKDISQSVSQFIHEFYLQILSLVDEEYSKESGKCQKPISLNYLSACTGILSVHISRAITNTIRHIVRFTYSSQPYISLDVTFNGDLVLTPTAEEVITTLHKFIDKVISSGRDVYVFQRKKIKGYEDKYMPLCITEKFISNCKKEVTQNIERLYEPILSYLNNIGQNLQQIYPDINSIDFIDSISDITFENGCKKINYYRKYLNKIAFIPDHEYFHIGQMYLAKYRTSLHDGLQRNINQIFEKLCSQHLWEVNDLRDTFKMIYMRATQKSRTTEELIETGKYMNWIKNEHLAEITTRVEESLSSLCQIINLGFLTEEHMQINAFVINWLDKIPPVVEEHLLNFDQLKFDAEERLQKVVEDVIVAIKVVYPLLVMLDDMDDINRVPSYLHAITLHMTKIKEIDEQIDCINKEEVCLSFPKSTYNEYDDLKNYVYPFYHLLKLCLEIQRNLSVWQDGPFENLRYDVTKSSTDAYYKELTELHKNYRKKLRQAQDENVPVRFKGTIDDPDILNWPAPLKLCGKALKLLDDFKPSVNVTQIICNSSLRRRHWKAMSEIAGVDITPNAGTTLRKMMKIDFYANLNEYEIISAGATKEKQLLDNLESLELIWDDIKFTMSTYKTVTILTNLDEIEAVVDDHNIKILNMKGSVFVKPHEKKVTIFYSKILRIGKTIDIWNKVQSKWVQLLPILSMNQLDKVIPKEIELFNNVKAIYNDYIEKISEEPTVMKVVEGTNILDIINKCSIEIEIIHCGVLAYLEKLRQNFARLFFISDNELISILSEAEPLKSQSFFTKIFPGICQLIICESIVMGIENSFCEIINFVDTIDANNNYKLDKLCSELKQQMVGSLKYYMAQCYKVFKRNNIQEMLSEFPQQVIQVISQIYWIGHIQSALGLTHNIKLRIYYQKLENAVKDKIRIINENDTTNTDRFKLRNLILEDLNLRYLVKKILDSNYLNENQLDWEAHTKYYFEDGSVNIKLMNTKANYMYEYLGNPNPIIITPLTDRCYRTLINAQQLHYSGQLQGPGDSGKSETIRTLAAIFGTLFVTFNCLHRLNSYALVKFIKGSSACGSWLCLENLNLLEADVLSVIAQTLFIILSAVNSGLNQCSMEGTLLRIETGWFVTSCIKITDLHKELPDNLKVLFRTAKLISPDIKQIIETMCYSFGLRTAKTSAKKVICVYNTYQDIMTTQPHYYFGVSTLKKIFDLYEDLRSSHSSENEESLLFNSIKVTFHPVISNSDTEIFHDLLRHVFPNAEDFTSCKSNIEEYILHYLEENNLQRSSQLLQKVIQLFDYLKNKTGIIMLGDTFTGKSTALNICEHIFFKLERKSPIRNIINPSSLDYNDLYGNFDSISLHWTDGIITKIIRDISLNEEFLRKWLILDGNIDHTWIENINDILNNDSKFYLESGEILNVKETTVIFEIKTLDSASPSTVSRCGLIYMTSSVVTWKEFVKSWISSCKSEWIEEYRELVTDLLNWVIPPCLDFIENNCKQLCNLNNINLVKNMIHITLMNLDVAFVSIANKEEDIKNLSTWIQATLISAGIMGLGSVLDKNSMYKFDDFYKLLWKGQNKDHPYPSSFEKLEVIIPQEGLMCDYQYLYKQRGIWKLYQDLLKNEKIVENPYMIDFLVPTAETLKFSSLLSLYVHYEYPTIIIGPPGTGKSLLIEHVLMNKINKEKHEISHTTFNYNTNSTQIQRYILSKLNKRKNKRYSPPVDKSFLLFIDNLNVITLNRDNSSATLELLRQHLDHGPWYDLKSYYPIYLDNVNIISAMNPTENRQNQLCKRFLRHFGIFSLYEFSTDTLSKIYSNTLQHIWKRAGFPSDINVIISQIVSATIKIYHSVLNKCKPTLNTCYYIFNLTDFSKVIKGCGNLRKETYDGNKKVYLNLWTHEVRRIFGDRLNYLETSWLLENIKNIILEEFNEEDEETRNTYLNFNCKLKPIFGTFNDRDLPVSERRYEEFLDIQSLQNLFTETLKTYNNSHSVQLNIILFTYAFEKLIKICRILSLSQGNALLLGQTGTGRQSLTKLASYLYKQSFFQPTIIKNYSVKQWNTDVKLMLREAGGLQKQCVFLVTEEQLVDEMFLQNIDFLLRNGEIPDLYEAEEKQEILEVARLAAQGGNRNLDISSAAVFLYFNRRCKENLHLIICHSINSVLRNRIRQHSSLMNCHIICFEDWPNESLESIGQTWIKDLKLTETVKQKITEVSILFHRESQAFAQQVLKRCKIHMHICSKSFIHLVKLFVQLLSFKQNEIESMRKRYQQGLAKLSHAENQILNMQKSLADYQPQLKDMTQKAIEMAEQIALETIQAEKASELVRKDEKIAGEQAAVSQILKSECEAELAQAIPILEDAISALNTLKPTDITLVKSMKNPPDAIKLVMAAVCVIKDVKPERIPDPSTGRKTIDYWGPSKRILGDMNFLQTLKDFDKDHIKPEIMVKIRKEYLPHKDFKPHVVAKASSAAEGLCKWIIAMDMYDKVAKEVAPKKEKLEKAEREYAETMAILNEKKEELTRLEKKLAELKEFLAEAQEKQLKLQKEVDYCNKKLSSAQKLIKSLSEERTKWTTASKDLETQYHLLPGNVLIFSGIIAYLAVLDQVSREQVVSNWQEHLKADIPFSEVYSVTKLLSSEKETEFWLRNDIPSDSFFIVNAVIRKYSHYYSIFIDPQYKASNWIQKIERKNKIILSKLTEDDYLDKIGNAISQGKPILINKIKEFITPCLIELLHKQTFFEEEETFIKLNGKAVKMNENFRLYMVCNLSNPYFSPEMYNRVTLINFKITEKGLEEELLKTVIEIEKPELKSLKKEITIRSKKEKAAILELEDRILNTLCESEMDILEDEASIKILDKSKEMAKEVCKNQTETDVLQTVIDNFKKEYVYVARYSANLFSCVNELKKLNYIYEFSLEWYEEQYFRSVLNAKMSRDTKQRCIYIRECFTQRLFFSLKNSLYETDKLVFLFLLCTTILLFDRKIIKEHLELFLKGTWPVRKVNQNFLVNLKEIEGMQNFDEFLNNCRGDIASWNFFFEKSCLNLEDFPSPWNVKLNNLQKLILIKLLRADQLFHNIKKFVFLELGDTFTHFFYFDLFTIYNHSYSLCPIIFFPYSGINVTQKLRNLAYKKQIADRFKILSLSNDHTDAVDDAIEVARRQGSWVLIENCHLLLDWIKSLEERIEDMNVENTHENFRLWLTMKPSKNIPIELLQNSFKIITGNSQGLKSKLTQIYKSEPITNTDFYNGCPEKLRYFSRILIALSFFHCILQEKRNFGILYSNTPYVFSDVDLNISMYQLQIIINQKSFDWNYLNKITYFVANCNYSGYIDDEWDIQLVVTLFKDCLSTVFKDGGEFGCLKLYGLPKKNDYKDYLSHILNLPEQDDPRLFGLNNFIVDQTTVAKSKILIKSILQIVEPQRKSDLDEQEFDLLISVDEILKKLPKASDIDIKSVKNKVFEREINQYKILVDGILNSLYNLRNAFGGESRITLDNEETAKSIVNNLVPRSWLLFSYPHQMSLAYFVEDLCRRVDFFKHLNENPEETTYWLASFFFPKALICQIKFDYSKKMNLPLEDVVFDYSVLNNNEISKSEGIIFKGLFIKGAKWDYDNSHLTDLINLYDNFPPILLKPIHTSEYSSIDGYSCPIYQTDNIPNLNEFLPGSKNIISAVLLPTDLECGYWMSRRVKIICQAPVQPDFL